MSGAVSRIAHWGSPTGGWKFLDVLPRSAMIYMSNSSITDPDFVGNINGCTSSFQLHPAIRHNLFGKLYHPVSFTARRLLTIFSYHIAGIFSWCSQPQMRRIYAASIIAAVKHGHSFWNCAVFQFPGNAMGQALRASSSVPDITVPLRHYGSLPFPAFVAPALGHFLPKAYFQGLRGPADHNHNDILPYFPDTDKGPR